MEACFIPHHPHKLVHMIVVFAFLLVTGITKIAARSGLSTSLTLRKDCNSALGLAGNLLGALG